MDNNQKLLNLTLCIGDDYQGTFEECALDESNDNLNSMNSEFVNLEDVNNEDNIVGTDLKQLIENELNDTL
jgi:hypothetical protein